MTKFIGRQLNVGVGKETVRGTGVAVEYWLPKLELKIDEKADQLINESSIGVISDAEGTDIVHTNVMGELKARLGDTAFGHFLVGTLGAEGTPVLVETGVYDHPFTVAENAQHPTFTIGVEDPNDTGANGLSYALSAIEKIKFEIEPKKYAEYTVNFRGNAKTNVTHTPDYTSPENIFLPHYGYVRFADTLVNLDTAPNVEVKKISFTIDKNLEDDRVVGELGVADRLNKQFAVEGTIEILYNDRTYIDAMLASTAYTMRVKFVNTDVLIGATSNPELTFEFAKVKFTEIAKDQANNDLVKQTLSFKAFYSITDSEVMTANLRNVRATVY